MKKYLTVTDLEKGLHTDPIWALNGAPRSAKVGEPGDVHLGIPKRNGTKVDPLHLPQTWLPLKLTDQVPRQQLLESSEFLNAVNNKLIILITPEFAEYTSKQEGAITERKRLSSMDKLVKEAIKASRIISRTEDLANTAEADDMTVDSDELKFNAFVRGLETKSDIQTLNLLRGRGSFKRSQLVMLAKELHDKPKSLAVVKAKL